MKFFRENLEPNGNKAKPKLGFSLTFLLTGQFFFLCCEAAGLPAGPLSNVINGSRPCAMDGLGPTKATLFFGSIFNFLFIFEPLSTPRARVGHASPYVCSAFSKLPFRPSIESGKIPFIMTLLRLNQLFASGLM